MDRDLSSTCSPSQKGRGKPHGGGQKSGGKGYCSGGGRKGGGRKGGKGNADDQAWDAAQLRSLHSEGHCIDLDRPRPQRRVEAYAHLTVAADWPEKRVPRSGSAFYLPLIWTAMVLDEAVRAGVDQLMSLGNTQHFHSGAVRRSTLEDLRQAQVYWRHIFSGWDDWVLRLRKAMDNFVAPNGQRGREALVAVHFQTLSMTACALIYGNLRALGGLPHISNARRSPDQDAIIELDFDVRLEVEASIHTLYATGRDIIPVAAPASSAGPSDACKRAAEEEPHVEVPAEAAALGDNSSSATATKSSVDKEVMKLRKKLREIEKLKQSPLEELDVLQKKKLDGEADLLARIEELETNPES